MKIQADNNEKKTMIPYQDVERRIVTIRQMPVIADADVADLYGVETKRINEAVRNNPDKFPDVNNDAANQFIDWITSDEVQQLIGEFGIDKYGQALFTPNAGTDN